MRAVPERFVVRSKVAGKPVESKERENVYKETNAI